MQGVARIGEGVPADPKSDPAGDVADSTVVLVVAVDERLVWDWGDDTRT
jgi:hypothetical protein